MRDSQPLPRRSPFALLRRWLRRRPTLPIRSRRPTFEPLEDRAVPATVHPLLALPGGAGQIDPLNRSSPYGYSPAQVRHAYGFDPISFGAVTGDGSGQTIAIVDAGGDPRLANDLHQFDLYYGLPDPVLTQVNQGGGSTLPTVATDGDWTLEISLDVEWAHAIAPGANILYVAATTSDDSNMNAAVSYAATTGGASVVSMSWGETETSAETLEDGYFAAAGVTYVGTSGDTGSPPIYPSASPNVLAVGATNLHLGTGNSYSSESAWGSSGGGVSAYESQPSYQQGLTISNGNSGGTVNPNGQRATPNVAYDGDPTTGVSVYDTADYPVSAPWVKVGGTSAGAPQWSALVAIADQGRVIDGLPTLSGASQTIPWLYKLSAGDYHDVTSGTTISSSNPAGPSYSAGPGYDLTTGRGSPLANKVANDLAFYGPGPHVVAAAPVTDGQGGATGVTLTFNEAIMDGTFTLASVDSLTGPGGAITPTAVTKLSSTQYQVSFADQTTGGNYGLTIGPNIKDTSGLFMDQDGDNVGGGAPDEYTTTFGLPLPAALPLQENFGDGVAHGFISQSGAWSVGGGAYGVTPIAVGGDAISSLVTGGALPSSLEFDVSLTTSAPANGYYSDGGIIFDYQSPTNFKYAFGYFGARQWIIGHRDANGWQTDAAVSDNTMSAGAGENLRLLLIGSEALLLANGNLEAVYNYSSAFTGSLGLGTQNAVSQFTNLTVQAYAPPSPPAPSPLPITDSFAANPDPYFAAQSGTWLVTNSGYAVVPAPGGDAVTTAQVSGTWPPILAVAASLNASAATNGYQSDGGIIFDYQGPTNFKFAFGYFGARQWIIGHRDANGWETDAAVSDSSMTAGTTYGLQLQLVGTQAILYVNSAFKVGFSYSSPFTGSAGLGSQNSVDRFGSASVQPASAGVLPFVDNFSTSPDLNFAPQSGTWSASGGRYNVTPGSVGADTVSIAQTGSLPADVEFDAVLNASAAANGYQSDGGILFDYQSPTNFKYAFGYFGAKEWVIGHRDANGWQTDAFVADPSMTAGTDYSLALQLVGSQATLYVNGVGQVTFGYAAAFSGSAGVGTQNSVSKFGSVNVAQITAGTLPFADGFNTSPDPSFSPQSGSWAVSGGRYSATPAAVGADTVSTVALNGPLPNSYAISAIINASAAANGYQSDGGIVFDYQSPTSFKYAYGYFGAKEWVIGHRDASGYHDDAFVSDGSMTAGTDYQLRLVLSGSQATLYVNGVSKVSTSYAAAFTGSLGVGTQNSKTSFGDLIIQSL